MATASSPALLLLTFATLSAQTLQPESVFRIQPTETTRRLVSVDAAGNELLFCFSTPTTTELVRTDPYGNEQARCTITGGSRQALFTPQTKSILLSRFGASLTEVSPACEVWRDARFPRKHAHLLIDETDVLGVTGEAILSLDLATLQPGPDLPFPILGDDTPYFVRPTPGSLVVAYLGTGRTAFLDRKDPSPHVQQCLDPAVRQSSQQLGPNELLFAPALGTWMGRVLFVLSGFRAQDGAPLYALSPDGNCARLGLLELPELPASGAASAPNRQPPYPRRSVSPDFVVSAGNAVLLTDRRSGIVARYSLAQFPQPQ
ncbi:MAG: hypothetical protein QM757_21115 [Paludibaculum sp.]